MIEDRMDDRPSVQSSPPVLIGTIHALHFAGQGNPMSTLVAPGTLGVIGATAYKSRQLRDLGVRPLPGAGTVLIALWDQSDAPLQFD
ncbi:MAG TPA: hypothetical protein VMG82_12270 [Candidatus Sulfotelmatobacter sp.]|nr:hypothetical protein [Candidatus Sulfotelmatobacter sp.]